MGLGVGDGGGADGGGGGGQGVDEDVGAGGVGGGVLEAGFDGSFGGEMRVVEGAGEEDGEGAFPFGGWVWEGHGWLRARFLEFHLGGDGGSYM